MYLNFREVTDELNLKIIESFDLEIEISRVFSINNRWIPDVAYTKSRKPYGYLRLHEEASALVDEVKSKIDSKSIKISFLKEIVLTKINANLSLPKDKILLKDGKSLRRIDLSNMWPVIENGVAKSLGLDDSLTTELHLKKSISQDDKYYLKLQVTTYGV